MSSLISPPLRIELLQATPVDSFETVEQALSSAINDRDLLPHIIGSNTYQIQGHLLKIIEEVRLLESLNRNSQKRRRSGNSKNDKAKDGKRKHKHKISSDSLKGMQHISSSFNPYERS
ncbi:hypothetical protein O181_089211 [Austropuccinia psidii MF-1]|uniref:Uncharacterized protein n=1 Tax=Austropuccinia psidii MF-1 TaxID=1389203 RepID=A0A9Q3IT59_9BASI|nr:hypothetical protein [Austropuccinia psidii MF-1]